MKQYRPEKRKMSVEDAMQAEGVESARQMMIATLRRLHAEQPALLPHGLPKEITEKLAVDAISGWVIKRAEQAKALNIPHERWIATFTPEQRAAAGELLDDPLPPELAGAAPAGDFLD